MIISARAFTVVIASAILMTSSILAATACDDKLALNNQRQHDHKAKAEAPHESQQQALQPAVCPKATPNLNTKLHDQENEKFTCCCDQALLWPL